LDQSYLQDEIKRKIRKLKKTEIKIRFEQYGFACSRSMYDQLRQSGLIWDLFFDLGGSKKSKAQARYTLHDLTGMSKEAFSEVISEYFWHVYYQFYRENGIMNASQYDPEVLAQLGLPYNADEQAVKKRFRDLAKKYHPDTGGDGDRFNQLIETYRKL
jgi:hypothetical protein